MLPSRFLRNAKLSPKQKRKKNLEKFKIAYHNIKLTDALCKAKPKVKTRSPG